MINYIINSNLGVEIYKNDTLEIINGTSLTYIKKLCIEALFTYDGYLKSVKKKFNFKYKIPVYINDSIILIQTKRARDYDNIWINYASIKNLKYNIDSIEITFYNNKILKLNQSFIKLEKQIKYLSEIRNTKVKHFHSK